MVEIGWVRRGWERRGWERRGWARSESAMWRLTAHAPHRARASPDHKPSPSPRTQTTTRCSSTPSRASCASARSLDCCTPTGLPSLPSPALGARTPIDPHSAFLSPANSHSQLGAQNGDRRRLAATRTPDKGHGVQRCRGSVRAGALRGSGGDGRSSDAAKRRGQRERRAFPRVLFLQDLFRAQACGLRAHERLVVVVVLVVVLHGW